MSQPPTAVGLGEILWDMLPSGRQLGGAPANFAYCSHVLGNHAVVASRTGNDELGRDIRALLARAGISDQFLQTDFGHPTGTVQVELDPAGQPRFEISRGVAWDFLEWTDTWRELARSADAVCFGTLAQRSPESRATILEFLKATEPKALRIFDVNLRQDFYSAEVLRQSLEHATAAKLNNDEVPRVARLLGVVPEPEISFCRALIREFNLKLVSITRGAHGSLLCGATDMHEHPGFRVAVKDTIGAGDAFTAGLVHEYLRRRPLAEMNETANRMGAWVASHSGAMPAAPKSDFNELLAQIR